MATAPQFRTGLFFPLIFFQGYTVQPRAISFRNHLEIIYFQESMGMNYWD